MVFIRLDTNTGKKKKKPVKKHKHVEPKPYYSE